MNLVIIGDKYQFNSEEISQLRKHFGTITIVNSTEIPKIDYSSSSVLIVDNSNFETVKRKFNKENVRLISIEDFLEKYLYKIYIPAQGCFSIEIKPLTYRKFVLKRLIDFIFLPLIFFVGLPFVLYSLYRIKKESPEDTIIFKQIRIGKDGTMFYCFKLRSMRPPRRDLTPRERVFHWGRFMRDTRLDEWPQLFNVLRGDMHLVGPRAEWNELVEEYEKVWPQCYHKRHLVAPGLTGWAQVNHHGGKTLEDTRQKLMYDLYYIKYWSLKLELQIIAKTFVMVIKDIWKKVKKK